MSNLPPDAVAHLYPVLIIIGVSVSAVIGFVLVIWRFYSWMKSEQNEVAQKHVSQWINVMEARLQDIRREVDRLAKRDDERLEAIKRLHMRVDQLLVMLTEVRGAGK